MTTPSKIFCSILIAFVFQLASTDMKGQKHTTCPESASKKSKKYFEEAVSAKKAREPYSKIREIIEKAISEDSSNAQAFLFYGDLAYQQHDDKRMSENYEKLIAICPDISTEAYYRVGNYFFEIKEYDKCISYLHSYLDFPKVKEENSRDADQKIIKAQLMKSPVPFNPIPLNNVSTGDPEYLAVISPDQDLCFFTRRFEMQKKGALTSSSVEKFMVSNKVDGVFEKGEPMLPPFNRANSNNEGGASISIDNKHLFFTVSKDGNFDIYSSDEELGVWSEPKNLGPNINDPKQWDSQPCISPDGKRLYYASFRDSINGTSDIMISKKTIDGGWTKSVSIGSMINTNGNEKTPFLHPDNKTLYFSSDKLPGMGGYDIFMCKQLENGEWGKPVNIGYPINTENDELGFFVSTDGKHGYFASNKMNGNEGYDIYQFDLPQTVKPGKVLFIKGALKDVNNEPISAQLELKNATTNELADITYDTLSGKYASVVSLDDDYILTVKKKGHAYNSSYFSKDDTTNLTPKKIDLTVKTVTLGEAYTLNDILFTSNSAELNIQDRNIITDFAEYLKSNPNIKITINGHTDNTGNPNENMLLSENRAHAVYDFLVELGINKSRLSYKGLGETKPIADNSTEEGKHKNRRTEFLIISN